MPVDYCFPFRLETIDVLQAALAVHPDDARAEYSLGNLLFDLQPAAPSQHWERSRSLDQSLAMVHRNLGWAYYRVKNDVPKAIERLRAGAVVQSAGTASAAGTGSALSKTPTCDPQRRLAALQAHHAVVARREDSFLREITVQVLIGQYAQALEYLENNFFHAQEGRDEIHDVYVDAHLLEGLQLLAARSQAESSTPALPEGGRLSRESVGGTAEERSASTSDRVLRGLGLRSAVGQANEATQYFTQSAEPDGNRRPWPETRFYQALSLAKLGDSRGGRQDLRSAGERRAASDWRSKVRPTSSRSLDKSRRAAASLATAHYLLGLGLLGKGNQAEAAQELEQAVEMNLSHPWARYQLEQVRK